MKISKKELSLFCIFIAILFIDGLSILKDKYQKSDYEIFLSSPSKLSINQDGNIDNSLYVYKEKILLSENKILAFYNKKEKGVGFCIKSKKGNNKVNIIKLGVDKQYHIANSFLEGYAPFETKKLWVPLYTIGRKLTYQYDHITHIGYKEIWYTSSQAFKYARGDCEDHAIALADWLMTMGEDARVVLGYYKETGHAWVILFKNGKEYILEATQKRSLKSPYKEAKYLPHYKPKYMFNYYEFWENTGFYHTTNYSSNKWIKKSKYIRNSMNKTNII